MKDKYALVGPARVAEVRARAIPGAEKRIAAIRAEMVEADRETQRTLPRSAARPI
jgi:hypothetical protein